MMAHKMIFIDSMHELIFLLGAIFATAFYYSKSLWASIIMHSLNDFLLSILFHAS
ncbi:hypothetical protein Krac_2658 [Ktedonobacter racemifer DSM 44963]|uniref:CAAX prenyl protease 2/Lysostaphin resistance protein A-like domain-containing protein n=1 Tax=Ktedonobacter racemifer DSM 44963 TaxID=485913 RepID=D6TZA9_KTERA|nr:hypothetical protein Krac_2658 [Ktedonobacter racemifer DSM 44963]